MKGGGIRAAISTRDADTQHAMNKQPTHSQAAGSSHDERATRARRERLPHADLGNGYYTNPVRVGPGADNTVIRVGADYYMMAGGGWPDQLVWHSRDLVNWRPLTRALRTYQGRAWASDLVHHDGKFYIYTTQVARFRGEPADPNLAQRSLRPRDQAFMNVVLWADDPAGPWSDPIDLGIYGPIDPGHVVDREGNRYLYYNKGRVVRLAPDGLSLQGGLTKVYDGWPYPEHWVVECKCLEAPKLTVRDGYIYMVSAQGGTSGPSTAHMAVVARSASVMGPWENSPYNPMVRTESRHERWWRQGHGTLIDDVEGGWWLLYTGYEKGYTFLGKQSLLLPVEWTDDGWPRIVPGVTPTDILAKPPGENVGHGMPLSDDFRSPELGIQWTYPPFTDPDARYQVGGGTLVMQAAGTSPVDATVLSVMPLNHTYEVEVEVTVAGEAEGGILAAPRSRDRFWASTGLRPGEAFAAWPRVPCQTPWDGDRIVVRLRSEHGDVSCTYSADGVQWTPFENSTRVADIQTISLYAAGHGKVTFRNFRYRGLE